MGLKPLLFKILFGSNWKKSKAMLRRKKYIISGVAICVALSILIFAGLNSCSVYYYTVSEIIEKGEAKYGENVRVSGNVVEDSIDWDAQKPELRFAIADESSSLPVIYIGTMPHTFEANKEIVVEGEYNADGVFHADELVMKCTSKYESED